MDNLTFQLLDPPMDSHGHAHPHAHILLPLTQNLDLAYQGASYHVTPRDLCFIPPNRFHHCYCRAELITMNIPAHMIKQSDLTALEDKTVYPIEEQLVPLTQLIKDEVLHNPSHSSIRYLYYYLYAKLVETNEYRSLRYIREHFNEPISIEALAQLENYNPSYFTDWFRRKTGQSPSGYLRAFRIERSKELLEDSQLSLLDIALQVGYNSHAAFTRAFKEAAGCSPQEYRRGLASGQISAP